jgi:hypothetical protein
MALEFLPAEVVRPALAAMPLQHRVLRPAGGAAHGRRARQGRRHAAVARVAEGAGCRPASRWASIDLADLQSRVADRAAASKRRRWRCETPSASTPPNVGLASQNFISATRCSRRRPGSTRRGAAQVGAGAARQLAGRACGKRRWSRRSPASSASAMPCRARR